jgi:purine-binding chemotaxis protein CheW
MSTADLLHAGDAPNLVEAAAQLGVLRKRAQLLAAPVVSPRELVLAQDMLGFLIGSERYAIDTRYVWRALRETLITRLPVSDPHVLGLLSLQGELLLVFDLARLLGAQPTLAAEHAYLLVLGRDQPELAFAVDSFEGTEQLDASSILPAAAAAERENAFVRGVTTDARMVLDGATLLADPRLYVDEVIGAPISIRGER